MPSATTSLVLDHIVVNALGGLDAVSAAYRRLGFQLTPRGYHTLGSINHLAVFGENYLELLGYAPGERERRAELWTHPPGLSGLAFRAPDAAALHEEMRAAGKPVEPLKDFSRPVELDGVTHEARFSTFQFDGKRVANGRVFFCQHRTPELIWRPSHRNHPNGVTDIVEFVVACRDPDRTSELYADVPGLAAVEKTGNGARVQAGVASISFCTVDAAVSRFGPAIVTDFEGSERMVAVGLRTASLRGAAVWLAGHGVEASASGGGLLVAAAQACGAALWFVE